MNYLGENPKSSSTVFSLSVQSMNKETKICPSICVTRNNMHTIHRLLVEDCKLYNSLVLIYHRSC